jgi:hypothetical protein
MHHMPLRNEKYRLRWELEREQSTLQRTRRRTCVKLQLAHMLMHPYTCMHGMCAAAAAAAANLTAWTHRCSKQHG